MALLTVLLLLLLGVAVSSASLQKRIIGGQNCKDDERQYHVKVYRYDHTKYEICGGSLISDQWVLTAAHCWNSDPSWVNEAHVGLHPKRTPKKMYPITQREVYRDSNGRYHDIMLLKLPEKTTIRPIKLPDCPDTLPLGTKVQFAGYGDAKVGFFNKRVKHRPNDLQCAEFKIGKHEKLEKELAKHEDTEFSYQKWYSVSSSKKDTAFGDSGGGFVFKNRLYGVCVFTGDPLYALSKPSAFLDVCAYKKWIDDTINQKP
ncbi:arginine esterase-like isoform X1 [Gambusia affinis]|uniref:arginine esterase-like isoform X1 n=1 Tax=Gambusia affinis TaxID=33528 RepID=UPI001CDBBD4B|nr:arginine esterase-like isoform X1 [Gambusia affinis]